MNTKQLENTIISYKLNNISIRRFSLIEPALDITSDFNLKNLNLAFNLSYAILKEQNIFQTQLTVVNNYMLNNRIIKLIELALVCDFEIKNLSSFIQMANEKFILPDDLLTTLVGITYSTARGIIFSKTQGSFLNQFILPVIDSKALIQSTMNKNM
ncbi:MAG: hypothetical protein GX121_04560 [Ignavibacteria bacterium]|nr:hypothetical protein [Ignavibacteria bacterium]